ncbi:hypothetical protein [Propioniciclava tarda]|uniref:Uncharacterized protein n=1 Tax=Propioniciclava tarda TaxID=433330 RepID=A0A4Q9KIK5_PROTD|nr:hypothetical protein [Propioniciclava tarda]TBT94223.1 hypothetical protein ET996_11720 [Propioniciclava tarda]SMO75158.1 hypothetical protein SAMN06266982_11630 [Propioniciclava tarda]HQD22397.1 hypothetical protein [Arachnia sp.]
MSRHLVGKVGRVTGTIRPGGVGEVELPFGGGSNTYLAYPYDGETTIGVGKSVEVVAFTPPSSVHVRELNRAPGVRYEGDAAPR